MSPPSSLRKILVATGTTAAFAAADLVAMQLTRPPNASAVISPANTVLLTALLLMPAFLAGLRLATLLADRKHSRISWPPSTPAEIAWSRSSMNRMRDCAPRSIPCLRGCACSTG
jgi:hypothetical protein